MNIIVNCGKWYYYLSSIVAIPDDYTSVRLIEMLPDQHVSEDLPHTVTSLHCWSDHS